jgi:aminoglycoside phosphotransferase
LAVEWYRKAADQGVAQAQSNLGLMYANGHGVDQSYATAVKWYRKAAEQEFAHAQGCLGIMYLEGKGVDQNLSEALRWLRKADAAGYPPAADAIEQILTALRRLHETQPPPTIPIGARVELRGLQAKPELNGRRGVVVKFVGSSGRYRVQLVDEESGEFSLKAENLLVA